MKRISEMKLEDRPRERLIACGAQALSDQELLSILLGTGGPSGDVLSVASEVIALLDRMKTFPTPRELLKVIGVGPAKACSIAAALEFSRRRIASNGFRVREPKDIVPLILHLADRKQETFVCISLNGAHEVIATRIVTLGLANMCQVHPREVFADVLTDRACAVVVAHNHPSGDLTPSAEDLDVTVRLKEAAATLGIKFLDHIIFSRRGFYSINCKERSEFEASSSLFSLTELGKLGLQP